MFYYNKRLTIYIKWRTLPHLTEMEVYQCCQQHLPNISFKKKSIRATNILTASRTWLHDNRMKHLPDFPWPRFLFLQSCLRSCTRPNSISLFTRCFLGRCTVIRPIMHDIGSETGIKSYQHHKPQNSHLSNILPLTKLSIISTHNAHIYLLWLQINLFTLTSAIRTIFLYI